MSSEMLSFVLSNVPSNWEKVNNYNESYILFSLQQNSNEYMLIRHLFISSPVNINSIQRVQNPFQYGRFKLRQEMLKIKSVDTVFHIVHANDLHIALKHTCDYRRYVYKNEQLHYYQKQPRFYDINDHNFVNALMGTQYTKVLVLDKISGSTTTQSDYYIQYVVDVTRSLTINI